MSPALRTELRQRLLASAAGQGFQRARLVHTARLPRAVRRHPEVAALGEGSYLMLALSCHRREPDDGSSPGDPHALVAPFARRNYYREAAHRLKRIASEVCTGPHGAGFPKSRVRIFSNSRFPEKALAAAAGLGFLGANSLVIAPELGSAFIIAGLFLPLDLGSDDPLEGGLEPGRVCGGCRACAEACPVGAIPEPGTVDASRCLQALSTVVGPWPAGAREAWAFRLYGCQCCQDACPYNRSLALETLMERGAVGASVPLRELLSSTALELSERFKGTALDMSWIPGEALLRNALLAAGRRRDPAVLEMVRRHAMNPVPAIREAAAWAEEKIRGG